MRWTVLVQFYDEGTNLKDGPEVENGRRYKTREAADRAAIALESRNMANGSLCSCRPGPLPLVVEAP